MVACPRVDNTVPWRKIQRRNSWWKSASTTVVQYESAGKYTLDRSEEG